jgi:hypothetical protein
MEYFKRTLRYPIISLFKYLNMAEFISDKEANGIIFSSGYAKALFGEKQK